MLVQDNQPKYAVSCYLATAGIGGHLLGSDEKEIIYLVFGIVDLQNKEVSDQNVDKRCVWFSVVVQSLDRRAHGDHSYRAKAMCAVCALDRLLLEKFLKTWKHVFPLWSLPIISLVAGCCRLSAAFFRSKAV